MRGERKLRFYISPQFSQSRTLRCSGPDEIHFQSMGYPKPIVPIQDRTQSKRIHKANMKARLSENKPGKVQSFHLPF